MSSISAFARSNIAELHAMADQVDEASLEAMAQAWSSAARVYFTGVGRSGLVAKAVAMRLMHIGRTVYVVGEVVTPGIAEGDLLVAISSSGRGSVADQARAAVARGAGVAAVVAAPDNELAALSATVLVLPARTSVPTQQHAGSLFEQSVLIFGDALCRSVQARLAVPASQLDARHANIS